MSTYYKIRSKASPLMFVKGTPAYLSYDKKGRMFQSIGALRSFLTSCINGYSRHDITSWEIIELQTVEVSVKEVIDVVKPEKIVQLLQRDYS